MKPCCWIAILLLAIPSALQFADGAAAPWAVAAAVACLAALNIVALRVIKDAPRLARATVVFTAGIMGVFAVQLLPLPPLFPHTTALRAAHGAGSLWPGTADLYLTLRSAAHVAAFVLTALLVVRLRRAGLTMDWVLQGLVIVLVLQGVTALAQHLVGGLRADDAVRGTFPNRNAFAGAMGLGLACAAGLAVTRLRWPPRAGKHIEASLPWALAALLFAVCIVLSQSRGGAIATATALAAIPLLYRARRGLAGAFGMFAIGAVCIGVVNPRFEELGRNDQDANERLVYWNTAVAAGAHQPVLGFGVGTYSRAYQPFQPPAITGRVLHAHNEYVNAFFEGGVVWLGILLLGLAAWFVHARRALLASHDAHRTLLVSAVAGAVVILVHSLVDSVLSVTTTGMLFAALLGATLPGGASNGRPAYLAAAGAGLLASAALVLLPVDPDALAAHAATLEPARSEKSVTPALALSPYHQDAALVHARAAKHLGNPRVADLRYQTAADMGPAHVDAQREAGGWYWGRWTESGDRAQLERAARCFRRLFQQRPWEVASVASEIWRPERPVQDYEFILPASPVAAASLAGFLASKGQVQAAVEVFNRGSPPRPENAAAFDSFARALRGVKRYDMEAEILERRLQAKADAAAYAAAGLAWSRTGTHGRAVDCVSMAVQLDPGNTWLHALKAEVLEAKGDLHGSATALTSALELVPGDLPLRLKRARTYIELQMWPEAAHDLEVLTRLPPGPHTPAVELLVKRLREALQRGGAPKND
jgi:O-antigen ligase/tetratricopeptide (TPR) repeat protein